MRHLKSFISNQSGATAMEYGLLAALIAVAIIGSLWSLTDAVYFQFFDMSDTIDDASNPSPE